jgi:hypothetical protein
MSAIRQVGPRYETSRTVNAPTHTIMLMKLCTGFKVQRGSRACDIISLMMSQYLNLPIASTAHHFESLVSISPLHTSKFQDMQPQNLRPAIFSASRSRYSSASSSSWSRGLLPLPTAVFSASLSGLSNRARASSSVAVSIAFSDSDAFPFPCPLLRLSDVDTFSSSCPGASLKFSFAV